METRKERFAEERRALRQVIDYLWDNELWDYSLCQHERWRAERQEHIFRDVYRLAKLAFGSTVLGTSEDPDTGERYDLVGITDRTFVEKDGRLHLTECDGDAFREFVGIVFGASAELAIALKD